MGFLSIFKRKDKGKEALIREVEELRSRVIELGERKAEINSIDEEEGDLTPKDFLRLAYNTKDQRLSKHYFNMALNLARNKELFRRKYIKTEQVLEDRLPDQVEARDIMSLISSIVSALGIKDIEIFGTKLVDVDKMLSNFVEDPTNVEKVSKVWNIVKEWLGKLPKGEKKEEQTKQAKEGEGIDLTKPISTKFLEGKS